MQRRSFEYLTPRIRLTPRDLIGTALAQPRAIHFVCSPQRAHTIVDELHELGWMPTTVYEPIPVRRAHISYVKLRLAHGAPV
jgi:hypothetical protein